MTLLQHHEELTNSDRSKRYRVGDLIGEGAFAEVYVADRLDPRDRATGQVCIKVLDDIQTWHGESYFGALLGDHPRVVSLLDSFPHQVGSGMNTRMRFVLVFELEEQTVQRYLEDGGKPWSPAGVRREFAGLLQVLENLQAMGASHRDIKPDNVFAATHRRVKLGDFGIAKHATGGHGPNASHGSADFMPASLRNCLRMEWTFGDDLYQLGLLCVTLASGQITTSATRREVRALNLDDRLTEVLARCVGPRRNRFSTASEALSALDDSGEDVAAPDSLCGKRVVFTGKLPVERIDARTWLAQAGGEFREDVNGQTEVLVVGTPSPLYANPRRGTKLHEARRRIRKGQQIAVIGWKEFERLSKAKV